MIEIVYEKEKQKPDGNEGYFRIPNNIRQIGEITGTQKIYIEDYAYTYLSRIATENSHKGIAAILMGQSNWKDGNSYLFVKSAVALENMEVSEEHLTFTQEIWNHVYEKNKEYLKAKKCYEKALELYAWDLYENNLKIINKKINKSIK